jgi:phytoene dehydrogenase-like protein
MALPLAVLYLVVDRDLAAEGVPVTNFAVATRDDPQHEYDAIRRGEFPAEPSVWVTVASLKDPDNERLCRPGQSNLQLVSVAPPHPRAWGLAFGDAPGAAYGAAKDAVRERMLRAADRALPGLSESVVYADLATPYTDERFIGVTDGTAYGIAAIPDQMLLGRPGPRTHVGGLFLAGASTRAGHGITGTMAGGIAAASAVLGRPAVAAVRQGST